jgi:AcrR family transcriptional regulator
MADQRREPMLQAALKVIVERGYADTRIADVAGRAGAARRPDSPGARRRGRN